MCRLAPEVILELESFNLPLSRTPKGKIYQRAFGGQCLKFGKSGQAYRCAAAADHTGHAILHTLYERAQGSNCLLSVVYFTMDLTSCAVPISFALCAHLHRQWQLHGQSIRPSHAGLGFGQFHPTGIHG